jgi:hypothetical protein
VLLHAEAGVGVRVPASEGEFISAARQMLAEQGMGDAGAAAPFLSDVELRCGSTTYLTAVVIASAMPIGPVKVMRAGFI